MTFEDIIFENNKRKAEINTPFNPITGVGAVGERFVLKLSDYYPPIQYIPIALKKNVFIKKLNRAGSIDKFLDDLIKAGLAEAGNKEIDRDKVVQQLTKLRAKHDFCYWAISFAYIKNKDGGDDILFRLNRPQRRLVEELEIMRIANKPIRLILLKARQWGGSTCIQIYMAWIQLMWKKGWNSLIVSHVMQSTSEVRGMFSKLIEQYPLWILHDGDYSENEKKIKHFEGSQSIDLIIQRNSKIKTGTAESPDSARGGDTAMVHCTEVAFWKKTDNNTPEMIIRSACSGISLDPYTIEVFETTANGTGNYFYKEWKRAKKGTSDKHPLFIAWYDIEKYSKQIDDVSTFAKQLIQNREDSEVNNNGKYNWWLWKKGATLEAINWYEHKRAGYDDHADMAAEYPSDDVEAFKHSGKRVFNNYKLEELRKNCRKPEYIGELRGNDSKGKDALKNLHFTASDRGSLKIWEHPNTEIKVSNRYIVSVDVGGRSSGADYSVISVMDRYWMMYGDKPVIVAQWRGHIRHDLLAWKSAQIATYYNNALLVIESNTLETKDKERDTGGDHTEYILEEIANEYCNMYARDNPADAINTGVPRKWGFHTNTKTKPALIDNLVTEVEEQSYVERDEDAIDEYATYEQKLNGSYGAISGDKDDILMARAIGLLISRYKMDLPKEIKTDYQKHRKNIGSASTM